MSSAVSPLNTVASQLASVRSLTMPQMGDLLRLINSLVVDNDINNAQAIGRRGFSQTPVAFKPMMLGHTTHSFVRAGHHHTASSFAQYCFDAAPKYLRADIVRTGLAALSIASDIIWAAEFARSCFDKVAAKDKPKIAEIVIAHCLRCTNRRYVQTYQDYFIANTPGPRRKAKLAKLFGQMTYTPSIDQAAQALIDSLAVQT